VSHFDSAYDVDMADLPFAVGAIDLVPMDLANLRRLGAAQPVDFGPMELLEGSLPPQGVAIRALAQLQAGVAECWCVPFLIVPASREVVLGGCLFKSAPVNGVVEISYGIAKSRRGRGIATVAVGKLVQMAKDSGIVSEIVAHIVPTNIGSARLVRRLGFVQGHSFVDSDGETVVRWVLDVRR